MLNSTTLKMHKVAVRKNVFLSACGFLPCEIASPSGAAMLSIFDRLSMSIDEMSNEWSVVETSPHTLSVFAPRDACQKYGWSTSHP